MICVKCEQGSVEWHAARCSVPTASNFDRILTPAKLEPSAQADKYLAELMAGWLFGPTDDGSLGGMVERGHQLEDEAAQDFAYRHNLKVERSPFFLADSRLYGASPDYLIGDDELLEIKCPSAAVHIGYLLNGVPLDNAYRLQLQGQLLVAERRRVTICAYHPVMRPVEVVVERDEDVLAALVGGLHDFGQRLLQARETLTAMGHQPWSGSAGVAA